MAIERKSPDVTLIGRLSNFRKLPVTGAYDSISFELEIGNLQRWSCGAFGKVASALRAAGAGAHVAITGHVTSMRLDGAWQTAFKAEKMAPAAPAKEHAGRLAVQAVEIFDDGRRGWVEVMDVDGMSLALETANDGMLDEAEGCDAIDASWRVLPVLLSHRGSYQPTLACELLRLAAA